MPEPDLRAERQGHCAGPIHAASIVGLLAWLGFAVACAHARLFWAAVLWPVSTFALTGLFIFAHDGIHGSLWPEHPRASRALTSLCIASFMFLSERRLRRNHLAHHRSVGTPDDPDADPRGHFFRHLGLFLRRYLTWPQLLAVSVLFSVLDRVGWGHAWLYGFALPAGVSTLVLFGIGIYWVHHPRLVAAGLADSRHRAAAIDFGWVGSFLLIFFFNYHWLHHEFPGLSFWQLGRHRRRQNLVSPGRAFAVLIARH